MCESASGTYDGYTYDRYVGNLNYLTDAHEGIGEPFVLLGAGARKHVMHSIDPTTGDTSVSRTIEIYLVTETEDDSGGKINWAKLMQIRHLEGFETAWLAYRRMKGGGS